METLSIGGPFLGVPKIVSELFSTEAKDIAVARFFLLSNYYKLKPKNLLWQFSQMSWLSIFFEKFLCFNRILLMKLDIKIFMLSSNSRKKSEKLSNCALEKFTTCKLHTSGFDFYLLGVGRVLFGAITLWIWQTVMYGAHCTYQGCLVIFAKIFLVLDLALHYLVCSYNRYYFTDIVVER